MQVDREDCGHPADTCIAPRENATVSGTIAHGHHPLRAGCRLIGAFKRFAHVGGNRASYQQHIGVAWRCDKTNSEALQIVQNIVESVDLELAAIAGPCVDLTNGKRAAEALAGQAVDLGSKLGQRGIVSERCRLGERAVHEAFEQ